MAMNKIDRLREPYLSPAAWKGSDLAGSQAWIHRLSAAHVEELERALARVQGNVPLLKVGREDFPLPTLATELARMADELENGRGFAVLRGLPVEKYSNAQASLIYWGIGQHLGIPVSQNADGHLLGHVRDTGRTTADPATRGYQTAMRLPYHTDGSDLVGLLCLRPARSGGLSSIISSAALHNALLARCPDLVECMYRPYHFDRREEQSPGEAPYYTVPLACWWENKLSVRYVRGHIESAQRFPDVPRRSPPRPRRPRAVRRDRCADAVSETVSRRRLQLGRHAVPQQLRHPALTHRVRGLRPPAHKRHLLRLWLTAHNGRDLPPWFLRDGTRSGAGRGGIPPRDHVTR